MEECHTHLDAPHFQMRQIAASRTNMERLVKEGTLIQQHEKDNPGSLMNSKGEFGKSKMVRFVTTVDKC